MSRILRNRLNWRAAISPFPVLALLVCASGAFAAVPTVVVDAQLAGPTGFNGPQGIAVAPNGSYYVADTGNNQILVYVNGNPSKVATATFTLVGPEAVAVDAAGDLFIGDSPTSGVGRVIEALATGGVLNGTVNQVVSGGALKDVTALTVDTTVGSTTFGTVYIGDDLSNTIYSVAAGSTTLVNPGFTGLPSGIFPSALAKDTAGNLYVADLNSTLYEIPTNTTAAQSYVIPGFTIYGPTGLAFDPKENLYILTLTGTGATPSQTVPENLIEVPGENVANAFMVPFTGPENASGIGIDSYGTIYILDYILQDVTELVYGAPVNLGQATVDTYGTTAVTFNYAMNASFQQSGFNVSSEGDLDSGEAVNATNTCQDLIFTDGNNGGAITPSNPYTCAASFVAYPAYPGLRYGSVQLYGTGGYVLASVPFFATGLSGASVVYPLTAETAATDINQPLSLVVSGLDKSLYIVNDGAPPSIIHVNGPDGTKQTTVSTAPITLVTPIGLAINGEGDLYIADYGPAVSAGGQGQIVVVPKLKGQIPYGLNPGGILQHPVSAVFDTFGNLLVGDSGPGGLNSAPGNPGYIVEFPAGGGAPFKLNTGSVTIYFPQTIAADPYTREIYVGDGGYPSGDEFVGGQVVSIPPGGGAATVVTPPDETSPNPVGIVFDPAEQYYILDGTSMEITVVPPGGGTPFLLPFDNSLLASPSALAITNGGQNLVVANDASTGLRAANNIIFLDGKTSTLNFGNVIRNQQSATMTAQLVNIGSIGLTLDTPYYVANDPNAQFSILSSTTCASALLLAPAAQCDVNVQFQPTKLTSQTKRLTFQTDGYIASDSVLHLEGTGVAR